MASSSSLPGPALHASQAAIKAAMAEHPESTMLKESETAEQKQPANGDSTIEPGEIQELEVDMQAQAETIRTVFSDPKTFNVKVRSFSLFLFPLCVPPCIFSASACVYEWTSLIFVRFVLG